MAKWIGFKVAQEKAKERARRRKINNYNELCEFVNDEAYELAEQRYFATKLKWHVDHMIPLYGIGVSGLSVWNNLQVIPGWMNRAKSNKLVLVKPGEWIEYLNKPYLFNWLKGDHCCVD